MDAAAATSGHTFMLIMHGGHVAPANRSVSRLEGDQRAGDRCPQNRAASSSSSSSSWPLQPEEVTAPQPSNHAFLHASQIATSRPGGVGAVRSSCASLQTTPSDSTPGVADHCCRDPPLTALEQDVPARTAASARDNMLLHACASCIGSSAQCGGAVTLTRGCTRPIRTRTGPGIAGTVAARRSSSNRSHEPDDVGAGSPESDIDWGCSHQLSYHMHELCAFASARDMVSVAFFLLDLRLASQFVPSRPKLPEGSSARWAPLYVSEPPARAVVYYVELHSCKLLRSKVCWAFREMPGLCGESSCIDQILPTCSHTPKVRFPTLHMDVYPTSVSFVSFCSVLLKKNCARLE